MVGLVCKVLLVATVIAGCYGVDITEHFKVCDRNSVDLNDCMVEAVQMGLSTMANGIEGLGLPPLDPFRQKELKLDYDKNQIKAKLHMKNIYVAGLKDATVLDARVKADDDQLLIEIDLTADKVFVEGSYKGAGQYNALKIAANGGFNVTMTGLKWTWKLDGTLVNVDSNTFIKIYSVYMRPNVENMVTHLSNTNPDSREWTDLGTSFMNANWPLLYNELVPYAQANWNQTGIRIANNLFMKFPYDEILPIGS